MSPALDITVVVMTFNEVATLAATIDEIRGALDRLGRPWEVLIVDDGSIDGSSARADALAAADPRLRVVHHPRNLGLGGVYRTGFEQARGEHVTFFPADGQFPAEIIPEFRSAITGVDMVLGLLPSRRDSRLGHLLSTGEKALYRVVVGAMPPFQGILLFRRALLDGMPLRSQGRGWGILMEFLLRAHRGGARFVNRTTVLRPRTAGRSKVNNLRTILANVRQLLVLRTLLRDPSARPLVAGIPDA
ncbi:MAG: glycosyltransferase family 2 protein [Gemmatimonadota bacterium]